MNDNDNSNVPASAMIGVTITIGITALRYAVRNISMYDSSSWMPLFEETFMLNHTSICHRSRADFFLGAPHAVNASHSLLHWRLLQYENVTYVCMCIQTYLSRNFDEERWSKGIINEFDAFPIYWRNCRPIPQKLYRNHRNNKCRDLDDLE